MMMIMISVGEGIVVAKEEEILKLNQTMAAVIVVENNWSTKIS